MNTHEGHRSRQPAVVRTRNFRISPLAQAMALALAGAASAVAPPAHAQRAFSAGWMAQKNMAQNIAIATGRLPNGTPASNLTSPQAQQQRASEQLQRSIGNLNLAAQAIAAQQAAQAAARQAALDDPSSVPDGLADGGLKVDTNSLTAGWLNAQAPVQSQGGDGRTTVTIQQTGDRAILNWESFNVGKRTTVDFKQQADWAVLNRINDPQARPSQIQGQIKGDGTVLIANRNGIVFSGSSQTDTRNLVAAAAKIGDEQFKARGIYSEQASGAYTPSFTEALGAVKVEAGAQLTTHTPASVTRGGGYALLLGAEVDNAGTITTPRGQVQLAAGDAFVVRAGQGTDANQSSTTRGNEVAPLFDAGSTAGTVTNRGLLRASEGDITLTGRKVVQDGVAVATTTVDTRGTIHLLASASDKDSSITVTQKALNAILLDDQNGRTALDSQRDALIAESAKLDFARRTTAQGVFDNLSLQDDRRDQSRIEIVSGGGVLFEGGSTTLATGGQLAVSSGAAGGRSTVADGARLDVSGAVGVQVAMASNNIEINIQGNEQRDAPLNRDTTWLNNANVWIDRRQLVHVAAGTGGYDKERWYTAGGLLEVGGYLGLQGHGIGEWSAQGGSVSFTGGEVATQRGSNINLSGGTLDVQTGTIRQSWLKGADGRLYEVSKAPADLSYTGLYKGFEDEHKRWGDKATGFFYNPLIGPQQRLESGYTVGRDAGRLVIATSAATLGGDITADAFQGPRQAQKADAGLEDGYDQSHNAVAHAGQLILGRYDSALNTDAKNGPVGLFHNLTPTLAHIVFDAAPDGAAADPQGTLRLDADGLTRMGLGAIVGSAKEDIAVQAALAVTPGGQIALYAPTVKVDAGLTARSGRILLGDVVPMVSPENGISSDAQLGAPAGTTPSVVIGGGVTLDARGIWSNLQQDADDRRYLPYLDGGTVAVRNTGDVTLQAGGVIDVSSGAILRADGSLQGGTGGDVTLAAGYVVNAAAAGPGGLLRVDGEVRAYGVNGGGTLTIEAAQAIGLGLAPVGSDGTLAAGQSSSAGLRLANDYLVEAGSAIPFGFSATVTRVAPGQKIGGPLVPIISAQKPLTLAADWVVPPGVASAQFSTAPFFAGPGTRVPKGAVMTALNLAGSATVTVAADAFPDGIPVKPVTTVYAAGAIVAQPLVIAAGTLLQPGTTLPVDVAVKPVLTLRGALFESGFSHYEIHGHDGVTLPAGATLEVAMPVYRWDGSRQAPATGTDPAQALQRWTPPLYEEHPDSARLAQRLGADLVLLAGSAYDASSPIVLGEGSTLSVDPGQSISLLSSGGQVTLEGRVNAWGGAIAVNTRYPFFHGAASSFVDGRSIWVGEHAVLDAAARAYVAHDSEGRAYGVAPDGGSITLGPTDDFVVIRAGALLDASGAQATVDLAAGSGPGAIAQPTVLAGAGGSIALESNTGIYIDGDLRARAGGAGAAGGALTLLMDGRAYSGADYDATGTLPEAVQHMHNITLTQVRPGSRLPADLAPGQADRSLAVGDTRLGMDQVVAGGFDALTLGTQDLFVFQGDIDLSLGRSLNLKGGVYTVDAATPDARVNLRAPYVRLDGGYPIRPDDQPWAGSVGFYSPGLINKDGALMASSVSGSSALTIEASLIDLYDTLLSGTGGIQGDGGGLLNVPSRLVDLPGFASLNLKASGDVRLGNTRLYASGDIAIESAQLYPMSGASATILAGRITVPNAFGNPIEQLDSQRTLTLRSSGQDAPMPASVFGKLLLRAGTVDQGGTLRAPLGTITINDSPSPLGAPLNEKATDDTTVVLRPGSVTSVSAAGLVMPYGGTTDGLDYRGAPAFTGLPGGVKDGGELLSGISLGGQHVVVEAGATLDVSGGGDLRGQGFVTGRGGSVDVLATPLYNANPAGNRYSAASNQVYAVLPGYASAYAPVIADKGAGDPAIGRQIQIGAGVPGLPAGTYTLLPSSYALLPGAFRVEVATGPSATPGLARQPAVAVPNGSWQTSGVLSLAGTGIRDSLPTAVLVTPGAAVRRFSQYNETSYSDFAIQQAARFGRVRPLLPADGKILRFDLMRSDAGGDALSFEGQALMGGAPGGGAGRVIVTGNAAIDVTADGATPVPGRITLAASDLNAMNAASISIGGWTSYFDGNTNQSDSPRVYFTMGGAGTVHVGEGAALKAGQIFLIGNDLSVDTSAVLDTRGFADPAADSSLGYLYANFLAPTASGPAVLAVANGFLDFLPAQGTGRIRVADGASLLTTGTVAFLAPGDLSLGNVNLGARFVTVAQHQINIGNDAALAQADAAGVLPTGWRLTQDVLARLLRPATDSGLPALERLALTADTLNFYGTVTLDTGESKAQLAINTPAFYGWGNAGDEVRLVTDTLVWNGVRSGLGTNDSPYASADPVATVPGGPGSGTGHLVLDVNTMIFGYDAHARAQSQTALDRVALGFADVTIDAAQAVTANNKGSLSVGLTRDASGTLQGGALDIRTPLLTGASGSTMRYAAGGDIHVALPEGATAGRTNEVQDLGASLAFSGRKVTLDTAIALPTGKLDVQGTGDIVFGANAAIDLSGRHVTFYDVSRDSWGGALTATSTGGSIAQQAGSTIDVSAAASDAGSIQASALADGATVQWNGTLRGSGGQGFAQGSFIEQVGALDNAGFAALNTQLNDTGFTALRGFRIAHGDLAVGDGVRANRIAIVLDDGSLTVNGRLDASGRGPGSIALTASGDLTLSASSVLDVHATQLAVDSNGQPIDASNRAHIALSSTRGSVTLQPGATLDLSTPDGIARGQVEIAAPRRGPDAADASRDNDIAIQAAGPLNIRGAASIAVVGFRTYTLADGTVIDQQLLDGIDVDSRRFIDAAWANDGLQGRLAGLRAYGAAYHLRPGVELDGTGSLSTEGDIDLSGYRYGPGADPALRGSGEPGVLVLRATGDLKINGSISDGFAPPGASPDDNGWGVQLPVGTLTSAVNIPTPVTVQAFTLFPSDATLNFAITITDPGFFYSIAVNPNATLPAEAQVLEAFFSYDTVATANVYNADGSVLYRKGEVIPAQTVLNQGQTFGAGFNVGMGSVVLSAITIPAGTPLGFLTNGALLTEDYTLPAGSILPVNTVVQGYVGGAIAPTRPVGPDGTQGRQWAMAPMLAPGMQSWSMRLVAGADLGSADTRALHTASQLAGMGNITLEDAHLIGLASPVVSIGSSVIRTGTGDLELLAGGNYVQKSPFGVYTAGTAIDGAASAPFNLDRGLQTDGTVLGAANGAYEPTLNSTRLWMPTQGGDFTLAAQGDILGFQARDSQSIGTWLWRQGGAGLDQPTAWGINFGTYSFNSAAPFPQLLELPAFTGVGTLGGGNVTVRAGGNIGLPDGATLGEGNRSLVVAAAGSGRVVDGQLLQTGGGALDVSAGGQINGGMFVGLRGDTTVTAGSVGSERLLGYGYRLRDQRPLDPYTPYASRSSGEASFAPGDGAVRVRTLGDLAVNTFTDPGRDTPVSETAGTNADGITGFGSTWFTLWTPATQIDLVSAGGNLTPIVKSGNVVPSVLRAAALGGSIYYATGGEVLLMPSSHSALELLARDLISGDAANNVSNGSSPIAILGASANSIATPLNPAWRLGGELDSRGRKVLDSNYWGNADTPLDRVAIEGTMFMFGPNSVVDDSTLGGQGTRIYALKGDIVGIQSGRIYMTDALATGGLSMPYYQSAGPLRMVAGRDIVDTRGLIVQNGANDVSMIAAQGSVLFTGWTIAGPGSLEVSAGGQIYQGSQASLTSLGPLVPGDTRPGAGITLQAGLGAGAPGEGTVDYTGFARRYLDATRLAATGQPLADQPGKVARTYEAELAQWLGQRYGYAGPGGADALAYFLALPAEQQRIFVRQVYFAELTAGGREYNDADSPRYGSYLRGRDAIATLFPDTDAAGQPIRRAGDITLYQGVDSNAGIRTVVGGGIQTLAPGGQTVVGVEGVTPSIKEDAVPAGLLTQGEGSIQMYSQGSILLGLSRIMTTFGGDILAWSATGDINAGRGSKTTVVYTPPKREYDTLGNVKLSPNVPSTGAGIATLDPIPEVPPGDVDLIAPLGTIDAGEAGIRVSGNVNLAALQVVNAANIQVKGESAGLPVVASVNVGALTNASAAASQAAMAAQDTVQRERKSARQALPSVFTVRVLGFGNEPAAGPGGGGGTPGGEGGGPVPRKPAEQASYDPSGFIQMLGHGALTDAQIARLTENERRGLPRGR
ncbi:filamentous haemagglutinin family protein [Variovorax sp.]|jgi:filamentous hemagglutinin family protein|uniref:filamentous haemagglutinin family protein n=1 Tax=Variovorax sp. TaxID=1871043 RepID=UPI0011F87DAA|nr:filamentous haemagglutinin family protein [Variovorax sp.]TAJ61401.1 MAG: filamentous hemagglutinin N-terminal domain-containing protein [Variovorax sp.]